MNKEEMELYIHTMKLKAAILKDVSETEHGKEIVTFIQVMMAIGIDLGRYCERRDIPTPTDLDSLLALVIKVGVDKSEEEGGTEWLDKLMELFNDFL